MKTPRYFLLALMALFSVLTGCATDKVFVDPFRAASNVVVVSQTISSGSGRELQVVATCMSRQALAPKEREAILADPAKADCARVDYQLFAGTTFLRDLGTAAGPIAIGALIQNQAIDGNCGAKCQGGGVNTTQNTVINLCNGGPCGR